MKRIIYSLLALLMLAGCENGKTNTKEKIKITNVELVPPAVEDIKAVDSKQTPRTLNLSIPANSVGNAGEVSKKIIKEGDISFEAKDIKQTRNVIYNSLTRLGGYIGREIETNNSDNNRKECTLNIRVPAKNFEQFLSGVTAAAEKIDSKNIRIKDVTTEYIDITADLANKKKLEERYQELLKKANKMADMLEIESKLTEIRTDIDAAQGRLNYLIKQVEYSSLDITFYTKQLVQDNGNTFGYRLVSALSDGWIVLGGLFFGFLQVWPVWILLGVSVIIIKKWRRKQRSFHF